MIAVPIKEDYTMARAPYWGWLIAIIVMNAMLPYEAGILAIFLLVGLVFITYVRVKNIGWHGAWTLCLFLPFFSFFIGFFPSKKPLSLVGERL